MAVNAQQWAQRWVDGMTQAEQKIRQGVRTTTKDQAQLAIDAEQKMRTNWLASVDSKQWMGRMMFAGTDAWRRGMEQKGIARIADGVRAAQGKMQNYATVALPIYQALQTTIRAMPKITPQDSEARMLAWIRGIRAQKANLQNYR